MYEIEQTFFLASQIVNPRYLSSAVSSRKFLLTLGQISESPSVSAARLLAQHGMLNLNYLKNESRY